MVLTIGVGGRQPDRGLVAADLLSDLEPLGEQMDERGVDVVDARPEVGELVVGRLGGHRPDVTALVTDRYPPIVAASSDLPIVFVDHPFPDVYRDLVDGRAHVVGPGPGDGLDRAVAVVAGATWDWNAAAFALAPLLRVISRTGVGYDNVNVADAVLLTVCPSSAVSVNS